MTSFRQAWRALVRRRAFAILTTLTFAAGIAVVTTTFSVVNTVLLRPLPYPGGGQLVSVLESSPGKRERSSLIAPARLQDWNRLTHAFQAISGSYSETVTDTSGSEPERLDGRRVMPQFFEVYGMKPLAGRTFVADEERFGGAAAAVISEGFWTRRFARSAAAVGSRLTIGGTAFTIVGVMPHAFSTAAVDIWVPAQTPPFIVAMRDARFITGVGRIKPGFTIDDARADLARVQNALGDEFPKTDRGWSAEIRDLKSLRVDDFRRPLLLVLGAVGLLFAIAIANVAGLVLVQLHRRASELAVRAAIGASRAQVVAALLREIAIIAAIGAAAGAAASVWLTRLASVALASIPRMVDVSVDGRALALVAGATIAAALVFGVLPAIAATRSGPAALLASAGRGSSGARHRLQSILVVSQLALGVVLAGGAGLLVRSYEALARVDAGVEPSHVLTFHVGAAWNEDRTRVGQLQERLLARLQELPEVRAAGYTNFLPASGASLRSQVIVDGITPSTDTVGFTVGTRTVTPGYLRALRIPLVAGVWCSEPRADLDDAARTREVMVNRQFVARYANGLDVVARQLKFDAARVEYRITGVVGDVLEDSLASPAVPYVYLCMPTGAWPDPEYVVRAEGDPRALIPSVRAIVKSLDPSRPFFGPATVASVIDGNLDQPRLNAGVIGAFAAAALALAALGLYGLLTLLVTERRRELGVRMALGAAPRDLVGVVVAGAGRLVAMGVGAGVMLTLGAAQLLRSLLFGVAPYDALAVGAAVAALGTVALIAAAVPARQASRVSAMEAMRTP
jgi:putative ABC transport system permease protein